VYRAAVGKPCTRPRSQPPPPQIIAADASRRPSPHPSAYSNPTSSNQPPPTNLLQPSTPPPPYKQDTIVQDPFFEHMPRFFSLSFPELLAEKHPTAWIEFEKGEIGEDELFDKFFKDGRRFDGAALVEHMVGSACLMVGCVVLCEAPVFVAGRTPPTHPTHPTPLPNHHPHPPRSATTTLSPA
jgi:hypothetical protein